MPPYMKLVAHITALSEAEFVTLFNAEHAGMAKVCWRTANSVVIPSVPPQAHVPLPTGPAVTTNVNTNVNPTIRVEPKIMVHLHHPETTHKAAPPPMPAARASNLQERPVASSRWVQQSLGAKFEQPWHDFTGLSDLDVLQKVSWTPVESGGDSIESASSKYRNAFMVEVSACCIKSFLTLPRQLAVHACVVSEEGADFLLAEFRRMLGMYMRKCGLSENTSLLCCKCHVPKACLTMAYCTVCDSNLCISPTK